jgi:hypothetical protein
VQASIPNKSASNTSAPVKCVSLLVSHLVCWIPGHARTLSQGTTTWALSSHIPRLLQVGKHAPGWHRCPQQTAFDVGTFVPSSQSTGASPRLPSPLTSWHPGHNLVPLPMSVQNSCVCGTCREFSQNTSSFSLRAPQVAVDVLHAVVVQLWLLSVGCWRASGSSLLCASTILRDFVIKSTHAAVVPAPLLPHPFVQHLECSRPS